MKQIFLRTCFVIGLLSTFELSACLPISPAAPSSGRATPHPEEGAEIVSTPLPTRPSYQPGDLVDYTAQTGDTLPALAAHFNTTEKEIRQANPIIPPDATTMPPGFPMKIPIYFESLWGSPFQIIPDNLFINGPDAIGFDPVEFVNNQPGWFKNYTDYAGNRDRRGGELVAYVAENFSISPRILLMIIEYQTGGLSQPAPSAPSDPYPLGYREVNHQGLYRQLVWAANTLNNGYYGWRNGTLRTFDHIDGRLERPDPWQNAATVAINYYYAQVFQKAAFDQAVYDQGFAALYRTYFGDMWSENRPHIPGSLRQPALRFPFLPGKAWAYTGGPHTGWGEGDPWAALDFAPPAVVGGCSPTDEWSTAVADGNVVRSGNASAVIDLDGDQDERTGWTIYYLHLASDGLVPKGTQVKAGDRMGHPSCEGGTATGTHVHIARKYNGEWIAAGGPLAFDLEGWSASSGDRAYLGTLNKFSRKVIACVCSDYTSLVASGQ